MSVSNTNNHYGPGDIVNGNKNTIINDLDTNKVMAIVTNILKDISHKRYKKASDTIKSLRDTNALSDNVRYLIDTIEYKLNIHINKDVYTPLPEAVKILIRSSDVDDTVKDIVSSIWMISSVVASSKESTDKESAILNEAIDIYNLSPKLQYTLEVYYTYISDEEFIISSFNEKKLFICEGELIGLINGLCRLSNFELASEYSNVLYRTYPTTLAKVYKAYTQSLKINSYSDFLHIWSTSRCIYQEIIDNANLIMQIFDGDDYKDYDHLFIALFITSQLCDGRNDKLSKLMHVHKERISSVVDYTPTSSKEDIVKPDWDHNPTIKIDELLTTSCINDEQFHIIYNEISSTQNIKRKAKKEALHSNIEVRSVDEFEGKFKTIMLRTELICQTDDHSKVPELKMLISSFFDEHIDRVPHLYPPVVAFLSERLISLKLSDEACCFLEKIIHKEPAPSVLYQIYLNALINAERWETLHSTLQLIPNNEWEYPQWMANASYYNELKDYQKTISSISQAISLNNCIPASWIQLIEAHLKAKSSEEELNKLIHSIPEEIFELANPYTFLLLEKIMMHVDYEFAEYIGIDIFIQNPEKYAAYITGLHFNTLKSHAKKSGGTYKSKYCVKAVSYTLDDKNHTKIIVKGLERLTEYLIDEESSFGEFLLGLTIDQTERFQMNKVTLNEVKPINIACFHYALSITEATPNESMPIKSISVPENPDEFVEKLTTELISLQPESPSNFNEQYVDIPLHFRPVFSPHKDNIVNSILILFESEPSNSRIILRNEGSEDINKFLVDMFSLIYLAISGYGDCIYDRNLVVYLTSETNEEMMQWLAMVEDPKFLRVGIIDGRLRRTTAQDVQAATETFRKNIRKILKNSQIIEPELTNTPRELFEIKDIVDRSTYSTLRYAIENKIPYFTLDKNIIHLFPNYPITILNAQSLSATLSHSTATPQKIDAIKYHLDFNFPYQVSYKDTIYLSSDDSKKNNIRLCARIINKYCGNFESVKGGVDVLSLILLNPLIMTSIYDKLARGGKTYDTQCDTEIEVLFNRCSLSIIKTPSTISAEEKVGWLWSQVLIISIKTSLQVQQQFLIPKIIKNLEFLASQFCTGHFLNINRVNEIMKDALNMKINS
ncbi:PIN domain-containing protein [Aeromonas dhakensis]|uniref:PIN domain-containing protein n=1 Tax=Aeromonas dhakensis TaxID=196024 RepID=UPI0039B771A8